MQTTVGLFLLSAHKMDMNTQWMVAGNRLLTVEQPTHNIAVKNHKTPEMLKKTFDLLIHNNITVTKYYHTQIVNKILYKYTLSST
jgi:hypothetical protein